MCAELTPELVVHAYRMGIFPMSDPAGEIYWYSPDPRGIIELDTFRPSRSLRQIIRRRVFDIRVDTAFDRVIRACADRPEGTWISPPIMNVYRQLHSLGLAHSVEAWRDGRLVGGLYGMALDGAFFGESMFYSVSNASKAALAALVDQMRKRKFALLDIQWTTPHLVSMGAIEIPRTEYLTRLDLALRRSCTFKDLS